MATRCFFEVEVGKRFTVSETTFVKVRSSWGEGPTYIELDNPNLGRNGRVNSINVITGELEYFDDGATVSVETFTLG